MFGQGPGHPTSLVLCSEILWLEEFATVEIVIIPKLLASIINDISTEVITNTVNMMRNLCRVDRIPVVRFCLVVWLVKSEAMRCPVDSGSKAEKTYVDNVDRITSLAGELFAALGQLRRPDGQVPESRRRFGIGCLECSS